MVENEARQIKFDQRHLEHITLYSCRKSPKTCKNYFCFILTKMRHVIYHFNLFLESSVLIYRSSSF